MVDLADIGRSGAGSDLANFIVTERQRKVSNAREQERTEAYVENANSRTEINENQLIQLRQQRQADNKLLAVKPLIDRFPIPKVGEYAMKLAKAYNYVNPDGTIKTKHAKEIHGLLAQPMHMSVISKIRVTDAQEKYDTISRAIKDPEFAKEKGIKGTPEELAQRLKVDELNLHAALGSNASIQKSMESIAKQQTLKIQELKARQQKEKAAREVRPYLSPDGKVEYFPNNVTPPEGYKPYSKAGSTKDERARQAMIAATPNLMERAAKDPNKVYEEGMKMNDDGSLFRDPIDGGAVKLPPFTKEIGKRGGPKAAKAAGEAWDDAQELNALLQDSEVAEKLGALSGEFGEVAGSSIWNNTKGAFTNAVKGWMTKHAIADNSPTTTALRRIQRMASEERKRFMGTAVTATELESSLGWLPSPGDSYGAMVNKNNLAMHEAKETFMNWLNLYKNEANMTPWYKTFGIQRFNASDAGTQAISPEAQNYLKSIGQ